MASTRLTKDKCASIHKAIMTHAYEGKVAACIKEESLFAREIYESMYKEFLPAMHALPKDMFGSVRAAKFVFDGDTEYLSFHAGFGADWIKFWDVVNIIYLEAYVMPMPYIFIQGGRTAKVFNKTDKNTIKYMKLMKVHDSLVEEIKRVSIESKALIDSANTVEKLIEIWPSIKVFAELELDVLVDKLPMIMTRDLDKSMGLPPVVATK